MNNQWKPSSWKEKPAKHLPTYSDVRSLDLVTQKSLSKYIRPFVDKEKLLIYEKKDS